MKQIPIFIFLLFGIIGCEPTTTISSSDPQVPLGTAHKKEANFQEPYFSWEPRKISILSLGDDWNPRPIEFYISDPGLIQFPADQLAYKEIIYTDEIDQLEVHELHPRNRLMLVEFEIDTNWPEVENPEHYTVDTQFQTAKTRVSKEEKLLSNDIRITRLKDRFFLSLLFREIEVCGSRSEIRFQAPRQYMTKDCRPDTNLVGTISLTYNRDQDGNEIVSEDLKPSILLNFAQ